ncbi:uncharacterized protein MYCFIDRAFT_199552 [Pseudocercospora fijiensis CIRAD86]|uniref:Uncharacterized protein n=1 Tax=Pseudocercospora fijiensis (strain CIRAD86) TaxID=383855 RepID=M2ZGS0_PSEFD|nr:uncharacterized protein MYCFIDRAFT_199552 [Pseudocercospora fijiensis CIRAD86]EME78319.1 hypothetical protein MYCFIDRAFT_199552 [Pseudocercospora fijiensis CIRAD86]
MARSCHTTQAKHQKSRPYSRRHFENFIETKQPVSLPAHESLDEDSERQKQRWSLRAAAQKSGKESDRSRVILEWGGNINSTLSIPPTEQPFAGIKPVMLDHIWASFTKASRVQRAARPRVPLEPEYGESCDAFTGKKNQNKAEVQGEEMFDFGRYFKDGAGMMTVSRAVETGESMGWDTSNAGEKVGGGS